MESNELIKEVKAIKTDFLEHRITMSEVIGALEVLAKSVNVEFSNLYNAFYSSNPSLYINN